ncbi:hypothetical protein ACQP1P_19565 [Dactylosporangium sp. CA-052675]|uniref:hypothetical protein n=1 Tax=Dactylosporangium sp. CA-052675 TaxID=3239927 RepID=UPI003D91DA11
MEVVDMSVELHDAIDSMSKVQNPAEQQHLVQSAVELIPPGQRAAVVEDVASSVLGSPSKWVTNVIWLVVFGVLAAVVIGGTLLGLNASGSGQTAVFGFVGIALGAIVGILAPRPGTKG